MDDATKDTTHTIITKISNKGIATLALNRSHKKNALNNAMLYALTQAINELSIHEHIRCLIIKSAKPDSVFCAGADLEQMRHSAHQSSTENKACALQLATLFRTIYHFPTPVVTLVEGAAFGGALGIIAASDIVLCTKNASFCCSETRLGLIPAVISPYLIQALGLRQAQRYLCSSELISAHTAQKIGLISEITDNINDEVDTFIANLLKCAPQAVRQCKILLREAHQQTLDKNWPSLTMDETMANKLAAIRLKDECKEGLNAFFEKRNPQWIESHNNQQE